LDNIREATGFSIGQPTTKTGPSEDLDNF
jgi:hypothetical protein